MKKKINITITLLIVLIVITVLAVSYGAFFVTRIQTNDNDITSGCFSTSLTNESASITLAKAISMSDEEGLTTTPYTFTLNNTCTVDANYYVIISSTSGSFTSQYINYKYNTDSVSTLQNAQNNTFGTDSGYSESKIVGSGFLTHGTNTTINIRLWLNENAELNEIKNTTWNGQIKVVSAAANS